ncbi:MAG: DUF5110 domain-containing protein [Paludibacteraceae bacterium]|nr:DUF5110 domain-containing protein [Paludibacteraceae bacterium]
MNKFLSFSCLALASTFAWAGAVSPTPGGVVVHLDQVSEGNPQLVRLEVMSPRVIHVSATPEAQFADPQSLIVIPRRNPIPFTTTEADGKVVLQTPELTATVNTATGEVTFADLEGKLLLEEKKGGGVHFSPYSCTQTHPNNQAETYNGWSYTLVFESPADEALFGLGQHQADEWNRKGTNEHLYQYNTKVSVPFLVSNRKYGILLDSYSLCRFGNPDDYHQLGDVFTLVDKTGEAGALTGEYIIPGEQSLVRREDSINFADIFSGKNLPKMRLSKANVVYEGTIIPKQSGQFMFEHYYSGYQRIFIDGKSVYTEDLTAAGTTDQTIWRTAWNPNARKFNIDMEAGKPYHLRIEWTPDGDEAYCALRAYAPRSIEDQNRISFFSEMNRQLDYYFVAGQSYDDVIAGYRLLTGKAPIMPEWLLGYWQSRERYKTQDEIVDALAGFRSRHLPIDNIVMDWNYWTPDSWGAFTFDPTRFSSPEKMCSDIHDMNARIMISCWPKYYLTVDNYKELNDLGMTYRQSVADSLYDWLGYKYAFYDAYDPAARKIFWRQLYEKLGTIGIDSWWMDASEPNVRDCTPMEYRKQLCGPTFYGSSAEYFNAYSIVNAEAIYDGQRGYETTMQYRNIDSKDGHALAAASIWNQNGYNNVFSPDNNRVFLLTRNGFPSQQRYSTATWSGDIGTRWEDMKAQITAGLQFSISGIPYWSQDIGGFSVENRYAAAQSHFDATGEETPDLVEWRELNARWHEWGMFAPIYRSHGQFPFREPWNIAPEGHPAYQAIAACLRLRYRLMPYIYSLAARVTFDDYTMLRPLFMDYDENEALSQPYQFTFGPSLMVCPVFEYKARQREVYFPAGKTWYDLYTGRIASRGGEKHMVDAPYDHVPVYVPSGAIIPVGPEIEYTRQQAPQTIHLYVYAGTDGDFTLYEDEGTNYGYEAGRYARIRFTYDDARRTLTIHPREGEFPGMLNERTFVVSLISDKTTAVFTEANQQIKVGEKSLKTAKTVTARYDGSAITLKLK